MASSEHLAKLEAGVGDWKKWREENPKIHPDLREANLTNANLRGADLRGCNLRNANLMGADLREANIAMADFLGADLSTWRLKGIIGISEAKNLTTTRIRKEKMDSDGKTSPAFYIDSLGLSFFESKFFRWEFIKIFGNLPFFGISSSSLSLALLYYHFVNAFAQFAEHPYLSFLEIKKIHFSHPFFLIIFGSIFLLIGSSVFALFCPDRIKQFSLEQWCNELDKPWLHYLADDIRCPFGRLVCLLAYLIGLELVGWIIIPKVYNVITIVWNSTDWR